jgi:hypothetical protein
MSRARGIRCYNGIVRHQPSPAAVFLTLALAGANLEAFGACTNRIVSETPSPNAQLKAVLFVRDCGPGAQSAHLSLLPAPDALQAEWGNTFIGEGGLPSSDDNQRLGVTAVWLSNTELSVHHGTVRRIRYGAGLPGVKVFFSHLVDLPPREWRK